MARETALAAALILLGAPIATMTTVADGPSENATWGLCQADDANEPGDEASNGTIDETPPFNSTNESDCENASAPWAGTPAEEHAPNDTPDEDDNPSEDPPDRDDNPGQGGEGGGD